MPDPTPPDSTGSDKFNNPVGTLRTPVDLGLDGIDKAATSVATLTTNLSSLDNALRKFGTQSGSSLNNMLRDIKRNADAANTALGGSPSGGGTGSGGGSGSGSGWFNQAVSQVTSGSRLGGGLAASSQYFAGAESGNLGTSLAMGGLRFLRDRIGTTRNLAISGGMGFGMTARQQGAQVSDIMNQVANLPGKIQGDPSDLLSLFSQAPMYGASFNFGGNAGGQGVRAAGMFRGLREAQAMTPGATVGSMMQTIGGFASNSAAQRESIMMTGGAYSMITTGGRQKSISEWAESILKWLKDLRGGSKRGDDFTYGELMAQYFPGSNIDAWFQANGVPQGMRDYWWTYALEKARGGNKGDFTITPDNTNLATQRLAASTELTRTEFALGGKMTSHYLQKEQANQKFNRIFGAAQQNILPMIADKLGFLIDRLPDTIEDMMFSLIENLASGGFSSGPASSGGGIPTWGAGKWPGGDVGDSGGYGEMGGTGLAGLSQNMRSKLGPMMAANPKLMVNSGLRDTAMQKRLKAKGHTRVSGKPSAHTRGDAADLGPPSEYGWIMKNAGKFGLKSGKGVGEPWHVGVGDPLNFDLSSFFSMLGGGSGGDDMVGLLGQLLSGLMGGSGFGGGKDDKLDFGTILSLFSGAGSQTPGLGGGGAASPGGAGAAPSGTRQERGIAAAKAAAAAGFHGTDLIKAVAIAGRESSYNPYAYNGNLSTKDQSYGLMQINMLGNMGPDRRKRYGLATNDELFDINTNMRVAYAMNQETGGDFHPWGGYKGLAGTYNTNMEEARSIIAAAGVGDIDSMAYRSMGGSSSQRGGLTQFNNTFVLGGAGSGPNGGIDVRRTVTLVADRLEDEMNKRLARSN